MTNKIKPNSYAALDAAHHFHPYSNAMRIQKQGPMVIAKGKGIKVWDDQGNEYIINKNTKLGDNKTYGEIENKIIKILETKIRPAVARDGGDITFKEFKDGKVTVMLKGSCSGCPSSTLTLKQGVQNLLCHYIPEVKEVLAV